MYSRISAIACSIESVRPVVEYVLSTLNRDVTPSLRLAPRSHEPVSDRKTVIAITEMVKSARFIQTSERKSAVHRCNAVTSPLIKGNPDSKTRFNTRIVTYNSTVDESRIGIVCSVREAGESDRLAVVFSPECGKFNVLVKSARKAQSKLAAVSQPFCEGRFYTRESRSGFVLYSAEIVRFHKKIQESVTKFAVGTYWLELLAGAPWPEDQWEPLFRLVVNSLIMLADTKKERELSAVVLSKIVKLSGTYPETATCAKCAEPIFEGTAVLDRDIALAYHQRCSPRLFNGEMAGLTVSASILGAMYRLHSTPLKEFETFWESNSELIEVERIIARILESMMERKLKTRKFLEDALGW